LVNDPQQRSIMRPRLGRLLRRLWRSVCGGDGATPPGSPFIHLQRELRGILEFTHFV
jgi:hypothetical protein